MKVRFDMVACYIVRPDAVGESHEFLQLRRGSGEFMAAAWSTVRGKIAMTETARVDALGDPWEPSDGG